MAVTTRMTMTRFQNPMLKKLYILFSIGVVSLYSMAAMFGWEITGGSRRQLPPDARQNGYRSFHFWHYGLHGGK